MDNSYWDIPISFFHDHRVSKSARIGFVFRFMVNDCNLNENCPIFETNHFYKKILRISQIIPNLTIIVKFLNIFMKLVIRRQMTYISLSLNTSILLFKNRPFSYKNPKNQSELLHYISPTIAIVSNEIPTYIFVRK